MEEMDYSEDGIKRFYILMEGKREEISFMKISDGEKTRLYSLVDETVQGYEDGKKNYIEQAIRLENLKQSEERLRKSLGEIKDKAASTLEATVKLYGAVTVLEQRGKPIN